MNQAQWIWLPRERYPNCQSTHYSALTEHSGESYTVAEFHREYQWEQTPVSVKLRFSGDTAFQLYCNGKLVATGPACVGGDFIGNETPRNRFYAYEAELHPQNGQLSFFARVRMMPVQICEYSMGQGGFMLSAEVLFEDGRKHTIQTDETWLARRNGAYTAPRCFDGRIQPDDYVNACVIEDRWHAETAPIPVREEKELFPKDAHLTLAPLEEREVTLPLARIYAGFLCVRSQGGTVELQIVPRELEEEKRVENVTVDGDCEYRGFFLHSVGNFKVSLHNRSPIPTHLTLSLLSTNYPVTEEANTVTSDTELNAVLDVCKHTLRICRQTHHLDSPRHCEPMACTGDYYIESLMTPFSFGDMRLAEFDLLRTAGMLERENGVMFHTTYSLLFVKMLWDVYQYTGNRALLIQCENALRCLLARFDTYLGENGLIETPPNYMFVDWIYIDGLSMHHPPKALGQTCLNLFYFGALDAAERIFAELSLTADATTCKQKKEALQRSVNSLLFDPDRGTYFEGLNTPTEERLLGKWMPQNTDKRYYLKHSNILAAYVGICEDTRARELVQKVLSDQIPGECQPYFLHFLLEAIFRLDLRESCTRIVLERWKAPVQACTKGLVEGFVAPEPTYRFDHSHAWGGTPLYTLPRALLGLEILSPGMRKLRLDPSLLGLEFAEVECLTPYGKLSVDMKQGKPPRVTHPKEITVLLEQK